MNNRTWIRCSYLALLMAAAFFALVGCGGPAADPPEQPPRSGPADASPNSEPRTEATVLPEHAVDTQEKATGPDTVPPEQPQDTPSKPSQADTSPTEPPLSDVATIGPAPPITGASQSPEETAAAIPTGQADVLSATISGGPGSYSLSVTVQSPDTGCDEYADWWEVLSTDGDLLYRRVLLHSHSGEQPFTRSGGPVDFQIADTIIVRAHMNTSGYGGQSLSGTVSGGLTPTAIFPEFAADVATLDPLPTNCAF